MEDILGQNLKETFIRKKNLSLVFAAEDLRIPVSRFGHIYLLAHDDEDCPDDIAIEFLGYTNHEPLRHLQALFATIPGSYKLTYGMLKEKEYSLENRYLYFYQLNIDSKERKRINQIVSDLSENTRLYPYNFATYNCAYYIECLLSDGLRSETRLSPYPFISPLSVVHNLEKTGRLGTLRVKIPHQRQAMRAFQNLDDSDRRRVTHLLSGFEESADYHQACSKEILRAVNKLSSYKFTTEKNPVQQHQLFELKQWSDAQLTRLEKDPGNLSPIDSDSDTGSPYRYSGQVSASVENDDNIGFSVQPLQLTQFSRQQEPGSDSALDLFRADLRYDARTRQFRFKKLSLIRMESHNQGHELLESFSRYFDASMYDWSQLTKNSTDQELVLRLGAGWAVGNGDLGLGVIPYFGGRWLPSKQGYTLKSDIGLRFSSVIKFRSDLKFAGSGTWYFFSPFGFNHTWEATFIKSLDHRGVYGRIEGAGSSKSWSIGCYRELES